MTAFEIMEKKESGDTFIVKFYAPWCMPCNALSNQLELIDNKPEIISVDIDSEHGMDIASKFGVRNVPYMIKFSEGEVVATMIGSKQITELKDFVS